METNGDLVEPLVNELWKHISGRCQDDVSEQTLRSAAMEELVWAKKCGLEPSEFLSLFSIEVLLLLPQESISERDVFRAAYRARYHLRRALRVQQKEIEHYQATTAEQNRRQESTSLEAEKLKDQLSKGLDRDELTFVEMLIDGKSNRQIASKFHVSPEAFRARKSRLLKKIKRLLFPPDIS